MARVFWTPPRRAALRACIEREQLTYAQAARRLGGRWKAPLTERACREIGQSMHLAASCVRGDRRKRGSPAGRRTRR